MSSPERAPASEMGITEGSGKVDNGASRRRRAPRRDAYLRREAILVAAEVCFRAHGYGVKLEIIARKAGVGRATMQRNFADRETLALAVLTQGAERLNDSLDLSRPFYDTLREAVVGAMPILAMYQHIVEELSQTATGRAAIDRLGERMDVILKPLVAVAKDRGELDTAVGERDIAIYMQMAASALHVGMTDEEVADNLNVSMRLLTQGTRPR